jgi:hypothetical protein
MLSIGDGSGFTPLATLGGNHGDTLSLGMPGQLSSMGIGVGFGADAPQQQQVRPDPLQCPAGHVAAKLRGEAAASECVPVELLGPPKRTTSAYGQGPGYYCGSEDKLIDIWENGQWLPRCVRQVQKNTVAQSNLPQRVLAWERHVPKLSGTFGEKTVQRVLNYFRLFCGEQKGELQIDEKVGILRGRKRPYYHCRCYVEVPGTIPMPMQPPAAPIQIPIPVVQTPPPAPSSAFQPFAPGTFTPPAPAQTLPALVTGASEGEGQVVSVATAVPWGTQSHPVVAATPMDTRPYPVVAAVPMYPVAPTKPAAPVRQGCPKGYKMQHPGTSSAQCVPTTTVVAQAVDTAVKTVGQAVKPEDRPAAIGQAVSQAVTAVKLAAGAPATAAKVAGVKAGRAVESAVTGRAVSAAGATAVITAAVSATLKDKVVVVQARMVDGKMVLACPAGYKKVKLTTGTIKCVRSAEEITKGYAAAAAEAARSHPVVQATPVGQAHPVVRAVSLG